MATVTISDLIAETSDIGKDIKNGARSPAELNRDLKRLDTAAKFAAVGVRAKAIEFKYGRSIGNIGDVTLAET